MSPPGFLICSPFQGVLIRLGFRRGGKHGSQVMSGHRENAPSTLQHLPDCLSREQFRRAICKFPSALGHRTASAMTHMIVAAGDRRCRNRRHHFSGAHPLDQFTRRLLAGGSERLRVTPIKQNVLVQIGVWNTLLPPARRTRRSTQFVETAKFLEYAVMPSAKAAPEGALLTGLPILRHPANCRILLRRNLEGVNPFLFGKEKIGQPPGPQGAIMAQA